jgi:hypothetical protein
MGRYSYDKALRLKHIFSPLFVKGLGMSCADFFSTTHRSGTRAKRIYINNVFASAIRFIMDTCINEDARFNGYRNSYSIYIRRKSETDIDRILKTGIYKGVDLIESEFNFYEFTFYARPGKYAGVRISYKRYQELVGLVNHGKRYIKKKRKVITTKDVVTAMTRMYQVTPKRFIEIIIRHGMEEIRKAVLRNHDVVIRNDSTPINFVIYRPNFAVRKKWAANVSKQNTVAH